MRWSWLSAVIACAMLGSAASAIAQSRPAPSVNDNLAAIRKQQERLAAIGDRLAVANARWCASGRSLGWTLAELGQYPKDSRQAVRRTWAVADGAVLFVTAAPAGGAAADAGIVPGTGIVSINGSVPLRNPYPQGSRYALDSNEARIQRAIAAGPVHVETISSTGVRGAVDLAPRSACPSRFEIVPENEEQAYADGNIVQVTIGMALYTADNDEELAAVVAHELSHNILRHVARQREAGVPGDYTRYLGRYTRMSRKMEEEADRLSVWLLAAAGYNPEAPVNFWQRFGPGHDTVHPFVRTHDAWQDRVTAVRDELAVMQAARRLNRNARPALLDLAAGPTTPARPTTPRR